LSESKPVQVVLEFYETLRDSRINDMLRQEGSQVTVEARILPEPGRRQPPLPVTSIYIVRDGLITSIESMADTSRP